ncbi:protein of unknown function [Arenibacter nanhaiticus]|uniref:3-keto-alpha-glucoside-1,2-lyase/3-keto-2-hydroxy-glucal hydratase domain-containing protein n=1 Tax=Arenibacter nanhaiticus TaxID=558155 RepID=A0A1M6H1E7_9FLAO|nr:DUF1080 domain-containing protein [Arenibacter nanhaiticus]SHJ16028.1 protein of unknown function [Arenibacter nanhaiticus]
MKNNSKLKLLALSVVIGSVVFYLGSSFKKHTEWVQLFNGKDLKNWQIKITGHELNENFANTFKVEDGNIQVRYDEYDTFDEQFGHLFYEKPFSTYLFAVEYRFVGDQVKGGPGWAYRNSGVMIHGQDPAEMTVDQDFPNSIEVQLLGGNGKDERSTANLCTPGTQYEKDGKIMKQHCFNSNSKTYHGEQWVRAEILALGDSLIVHYVNGEEVMRYEKPQLDPVNGAEQGALLKGGTISLQSESHPVDFRKVEIINLEKYADNPKKLQKVVKKLMAEKRLPKQ